MSGARTPRAGSPVVRKRSHWWVSAICRYWCDRKHEPPQFLSKVEPTIISEQETRKVWT